MTGRLLIGDVDQECIVASGLADRLRGRGRAGEGEQTGTDKAEIYQALTQKYAKRLKMNKNTHSAGRLVVTRGIVTTSAGDFSNHEC